ncbi:uroplakin-3b-like protein 2 isoform X2 [Calypte anna]|uniref:uroplakin-3b-like protein 2 isoform X2 n=1 Tax=Calypte anna TaxID=9244 RepID=UPI0011C3498E|nr:uroplakin-3b-like protein 2 isoform X2 [Calypte anna]
MVAAGRSHGDTQPGCPHSRLRHSSSLTMVPLLLLLLATAHGFQTVSYTPELAKKFLEGQTTTTTFVLEQPRCAFKFQENDINIRIWLVVAAPEAVSNFNNSLEPGSPERAFQNFLNGTNAYMTLGTTTDHYPCPKNPQDITVLRVGSDTSCAHDKDVPTCNGPLPGPGPYRVKFLAFNGSEPVKETQWSELITLKKATPFGDIPASDGKHSAGMIALTTILSILFAILLAGLVAMMISGGLDSCGSSSFTKPDMVTVQRYNTHHVYDQPAARL